MEQLITTILWSILIVFIYAICTTRLLSRELKNYLRWVKGESSGWKFALAISFVFLFSPIILFVYIIANLTWKIFDILLK